MSEALTGVDGPLDRQLIRGAMTRLSPGHRAVIWRAHFLGWTTGRIACDLTITEDLVKRRLHEALHWMAAHLGGHDPSRNGAAGLGNVIR